MAEFRFIRGNNHQIIRVDGFYGGIAPNGLDFHLHGYTERFPLPERMVFDQQGQEVVEQRVVSDPAIEREWVVDIVIPPQGLAALRAWIDLHLQRTTAPTDPANGDNIVRANWGHGFKN